MPRGNELEHHLPGSVEIAQRLNRSPRTIDHHVEAIFAKLGVATRAEAVSAAYRIGVAAAHASGAADATFN